MLRCLLLCTALFLQGCASRISVPASDYPAPATAIELAQVPFFPQKTHQCGPAALAMALQYSNVEVTPDVLSPALFLPGKKGSLQVEMLATARRHGRIPYPVEPTLVGLISELYQGRPVLVLQNLGLSWFPIWHYALVIGYEPDSRQFLLRSGTQFRKSLPVATFTRTWRDANYWGLILLKPGELPALPRPGPLLAAGAALEAMGQHQAAWKTFGAVQQQWPETKESWLGLANAEYALSRPARAESLYREMISRFPDYLVAYNNLAVLLADRSCTKEALSLVRYALSRKEAQGALGTTLKATESEIVNLPPSKQSCQIPSEKFISK